MPKVKGIMNKEDKRFDCLFNLQYFYEVYIGIKGRFIQISTREDFLTGFSIHLNDISDSINSKYCEPSPRYGHGINLLYYHFSKIRKQVLRHVLESTDFYK